MGKLDGPSTSASGVLGGTIGTAVVAGDFALGAGWGATASATVGTGDNVQGGVLTITGAGGSYAQATATVVFTYPAADGARAVAPHFMVTATNGTVLDEGHVVVTSTTTATTWTYSVLPAAVVYKLRWISVHRG